MARGPMTDRLPRSLTALCSPTTVLTVWQNKIPTHRKASLLRVPSCRHGL
jgi:hypothetical protein